MAAVKYVSLADVAKEHGVENIRVFFVTRVLNRVDILGIGFTSSSDKEVVVEGRIRVGQFNRDVTEGYKFIADPLDNHYASEEFYNMDFESLSYECPDKWYIMVGEQRIPLRFVEMVGGSM